ncbi:unnamed protein product [Rhizophagus irregularis]|nr:unnamed protein product [Rhizophagus irregularis]
MVDSTRMKIDLYTIEQNKKSANHETQLNENQEAELLRRIFVERCKLLEQQKQETYKLEFIIEEVKYGLEILGKEYLETFECLLHYEGTVGEELKKYMDKAVVWCVEEDKTRQKLQHSGNFFDNQ